MGSVIGLKHILNYIIICIFKVQLAALLVLFLQSKVEKDIKCFEFTN